MRDANGNLIEKLYYSSTGLAKSFDPNGVETTADDYGQPVYRSRYIRFGFTGLYVEPLTGKRHAHFRDYDPIHGMWLSRDPIAETGGLNLAAFCGGDPVNNIDPLGLKSFPQIYGEKKYNEVLKENNGNEFDANLVLARLWLTEKGDVVSQAAKAFGVPAKYLAAQLVLEIIPNVVWDTECGNPASENYWPDNDWAEAYADGDRSELTLAGLDEFLKQEYPKELDRRDNKWYSWIISPVVNLITGIGVQSIHGSGVGNVYWEEEWKTMGLADAFKNNMDVPDDIRRAAKAMRTHRGYNRAMYQNDDLSIYALAATLKWYADRFQKMGVGDFSNWDRFPMYTYNSPCWARNWHLPLFAKEQCGMRSAFYNLNTGWPWKPLREPKKGEKVFGFEKGGWIDGNISYILKNVVKGVFP